MTEKTGGPPREISRNEFDGTVTYEIGDGRWIKLDARHLAEVGLREAMRRVGVGWPRNAARIDVLQHGRKVGTVPGDFEPTAVKSKSFLYDPRPGDFIRDANGWIASRTLGPGDLEAIPGFLAARASQEKE